MSQNPRYPIVGKKILIVGLGKTGKSLISFLGDKDCQLFLSTNNSLTSEDQQFLDKNQVRYESDAHSPEFFQEKDLILMSPGVPNNIPPLTDEIRSQSVIISELEFAASLIDFPIIAVTGTNGKTTVCHLLHHLCQSLGISSVLAGNVGTPLIDFTNPKTPCEVGIVEVSSFQLETSHAFRPFIGVYLNIADDHLDRHGSLEAYHQAKLKLFAHQTVSDYAIFNANEPRFKTTSLKSIKRFFNSKNALFKDNSIHLNFPEIRLSFDISDCQLKGLHNVDNIQAALLALCCFLHHKNLTLKQHPDLKIKIEQALQSFENLPHRNAFILKNEGINYYNDSKATNPAATISCLKTFPDKRVILLIGGKSKDTDFNSLIFPCRQKCKAVICFGEAKEILHQCLSPHLDSYSVPTMVESLIKAKALATDGDYIVLSPACSSFDAFSNYTERGNCFKRLVNDQIASHRTGDSGS